MKKTISLNYLTVHTHICTPRKLKQKSFFVLFSFFFNVKEILKNCINLLHKYT